MLHGLGASPDDVVFNETDVSPANGTAPNTEQQSLVTALTYEAVETLAANSIFVTALVVGAFLGIFFFYNCLRFSCAAVRCSNMPTNG